MKKIEVHFSRRKAFYWSEKNESDLYKGNGSFRYDGEGISSG